MKATDEKEVLVFKTDAPLSIDLTLVEKKLKDENDIQDWNFDLEDEDRIFRVVSVGITASRIIKRLKEMGIWAEELL